MATTKISVHNQCTLYLRTAYHSVWHRLAFWEIRFHFFALKCYTKIQNNKKIVWKIKQKVYSFVDKSQSHRSGTIDWYTFSRTRYIWFTIHRNGNIVEYLFCFVLFGFFVLFFFTVLVHVGMPYLMSLNCTNLFEMHFDLRFH